MIFYYSITGNIWYTGINGAEINGSLINAIFSNIAYLVAFDRTVYVTLINVIFGSSFWPEKYARNDFAFHATYDMRQFVENLR